MSEEIVGLLVFNDEVVGLLRKGEGTRSVSWTRKGFVTPPEDISVIDPKLVTPDGQGRWVVHCAHVSKGDWLTDGENLIGRAIEDHPFGAHVKEPLDPA